MRAERSVGEPYRTLKKKSSLGATPHLNRFRLFHLSERAQIQGFFAFANSQAPEIFHTVSRFLCVLGLFLRHQHSWAFFWDINTLGPWEAATSFRVVSGLKCAREFVQCVCVWCSLCVAAVCLLCMCESVFLLWVCVRARGVCACVRVHVRVCVRVYVSVWEKWGSPTPTTWDATQFQDEWWLISNAGILILRCLYLFMLNLFFFFDGRTFSDILCMWQCI